MRLRVRHQTHYRYRQRAVESYNEVRLKPISDSFQQCQEFNLRIEPVAEIYSYQEIGGEVHHFEILSPHSTLHIDAISTVHTLRTNPFEDMDFNGTWADLFRQTQDFAEYLAPSRFIHLTEEVAQIAREARHLSPANAVLHLNQHIHERIAYQTGVTHVFSTLREVLEARAGVCQDFAHLLIGCCRTLGIPARYVSGYVYSGVDNVHLRGEQATHAWAEVLLPNGSWIGFDATNNLLANDRFIKVHIGRDYADVSPTRGVFVGYGTESLQVSVHVDRLEDQPQSQSQALCCQDHPK
jgi:transglutaminase-like putative cysteine protease